MGGVGWWGWWRERGRKGVGGVGNCKVLSFHHCDCGKKCTRQFDAVLFVLSECLSVACLLYVRCVSILLFVTRGAGMARWLQRQTRDRNVAGSSPGGSGERIFFSRVNFLCWILFRYPFQPRVTAVARKRPRSLCQKGGWQVTVKHTCILRMWLRIKSHCKVVHQWLYGACRTCVRRQQFHVAASAM